MTILQKVLHASSSLIEEEINFARQKSIKLKRCRRVEISLVKEITTVDDC